MMCFHLADNNLNLDKNDKIAKVRPFYELMNKRCLKFRSNLQNVSVDESMQPYFGRNSSKQRVPNQPIPVGYKMWVLADETGYVLKKNSSRSIRGFAPRQGPCYHVFADNFFCSIRLSKLLEQNNIKASGTLRQNRFVKTYGIGKNPI